jgi:hypothetical protein
MINKALVDAIPSEICALIKIVELGLQLQTSGEMADESLNECVFEAACLINRPNTRSRASTNLTMLTGLRTDMTSSPKFVVAKPIQTV